MADVSRAVNIEDLRRMARRRLPRAIFDFFDGGAEDETTLRENRAAFERVRLLPKVLVDVAEVDTRTQILGAESQLPLAVAPTGGIGAGRPGADVCIARAAKAFGIPYTLATPATASIESIRAESDGRLWFQLYCVKNREFREKLVARARDAGYEALLVTVDLPVSGKRERDPRNGFVTPFRPNWRNSHDIWRKPAWLLDIARSGLPEMENMRGYPWAAPTSDIVTAVGREMDASLDWEAVKRLRELWPGKLLLKGVERTDDAERAAIVGCDGVVVSNHGGRQLDGAAPTLEALPAIARAVGGRLTVLLDGGVRRGVDILKARALGAQAVLVGRATLFGAMAGGEAGAKRALEILQDELVRAMRLCGVRSVAEIGPHLVAPR
ncbi:MAG: alpha-hydroxy-acid oxidizing enzyme [Betaproteobacteria bacterium RIFCSPHIGHO2_12_FULL_69_13]|nr:MAG: alpha-hydroxy-acid oxidizing enzyme [Betaproteobacteria bacterium RIFCSPHIGHO2_12_FULL_69_13]OGA65309.1 MAG: alpha-hydroxy-acid oxidizing enzyme [Betaproteobacteria bacterium RIFCSPLOWO2_12_FULL_68_20]